MHNTPKSPACQHPAAGPGAGDAKQPAAKPDIRPTPFSLERAMNNIMRRPTLKELQKEWGGWRLRGVCLCYPAYVGGDYPVDLDRFTSSAQMLDMIVQVSGKTWATDACVAGLVRALDDILHPQAHLCSGGSDKRLKADEIRRLVRALRARKAVQS